MGLRLPTPTNTNFCRLLPRLPLYLERNPADHILPVALARAFPLPSFLLCLSRSGGGETPASFGAALRKGRLASGGGAAPGRKETRIQRYARMILDYIGDQIMLESEIRRVFGNTPDTSKALRLLNSEEMVERTGRGGRADPFSYRQLP